MRVDDFADSLYQETAPNELFHYTSLSGLLGILESGSIRASEVRYLNDSAEVALAFQLIARELAERRGNPSYTSFDDLLGQFSGWIEDWSSHGPMIFVTAFTQDGNLLSQWRGYAPAAQGVSFGLASTHLAHVCSRTEFSLGRCRYSQAEQSFAIKGLVDSVVELATRMGPSHRAHPRQSFYPAFARCEESILRVAALIKDHTFKEEAEWRIVSKTVSDFVDSKVLYRVGPSMLIPYLSVSLTNGAGVIPIDDVIVGPTPHPEAATESVQRCVARHLRHKHGPWTTRYCAIPYRTW